MVYYYSDQFIAYECKYLINLTVNSYCIEDEHRAVARHSFDLEFDAYASVQQFINVLKFKISSNSKIAK